MTIVVELMPALTKVLRSFSISNAFQSLGACCFQLSFIQQSLMSPELFCFADYPCHAVVIDILKAPPEDDNREIATWSVPAASCANWFSLV